MSQTDPIPGYHHTQRGWLALLLYGAAAATLVGSLTADDPAGMWGIAGTGAILAFAGSCFHSLTVEGCDDRLRIRFGPLPLFRRTLPYSEIGRVETGRTTILDGWGIHRSLRGGWVWNLWGRDCVVVHLVSGGVLRIGTDDAVHLARFLEHRTARQRH